jgi:D-xylose transport system permease protein
MQRSTLRNFSLLLALVLISTYFSLADGRFLSPRNLTQLAIELAATAVLSIGMLFVLLPGHVDLSVGSGVGLIGGVAAVAIFKLAWTAPLALCAGLVVAVALYTAMGWVIVAQGVPAFIITLGGLLVFKGAHWLVIASETIPVATGGTQNLYSVLTTVYLPPVWGLAVAIGASALGAVRLWRRARGASGGDAEQQVLSWLVASQVLLLFALIMNSYKGVPLAALVLGAVALLAHTVLERTRLGRYLYAIGGNEAAAQVAGVPIRAVVVGAYAILGGVVALAGYLQTAFAGASTTTTGQLMELDAIAACVIGGTSLKGGQGGVVGVLFGALIMALLLNGMTLLAVTPEHKFIARGLILALAVWMDVRLSRRS